MRLIESAFAIVFVLAPVVGAQQPEPGIWYGISPTVRGPVSDERFEIRTDAGGAEILSAPLGKKASSWGPITVRHDGSIEFQRVVKPRRVCVLRHIDQRNYEGICQAQSQSSRQFTLTKDGPPRGMELTVSDADFRILAKAGKILSGPTVWNRDDDRACEDDIRRKSWSLFCALYDASIDTTGSYLHLRPLMMEVRAVVGQVTQGRAFEHQLRDFNNLDSTNFADIVAVFDGTRRRLQARRICAEQRSSMGKVDREYDLPVPDQENKTRERELIYWSESLARTVRKQTYRLSVTLGPTSAGGNIPNEWLVSSKETTRKAWKHGNTQNMDVKGTLANGRRWRYFSQCGEASRYYDVPADASSFFDDIIDRAYARPSRAGSK